MGGRYRRWRTYFATSDRGGLNLYSITSSAPLTSEGGKLESEALCGLQVDNELDFRDQLDWQIRRFFAIEDPSGINARATMRLQEISSVAHQASPEVGKSRNWVARLTTEQSGHPTRNVQSFHVRLA